MIIETDNPGFICQTCGTTHFCAEEALECCTTADVRVYHVCTICGKYMKNADDVCCTEETLSRRILTLRRHFSRMLARGEKMMYEASRRAVSRNIKRLRKLREEETSLCQALRKWATEVEVESQS